MRKPQRNKRNRTREIHKVVSSVLNPSVTLNSQYNNKKKAFIDFLVKSTEKEFHGALDVILRDEEVFGFLNQAKMPNNELISKLVISGNDFKNTRLIKLFESVLIRESSKLKEVNILRSNIEDLFIKGKFDDVNEKLDEINVLTGLSIWEMSYRIAVLTAKNDYEHIDILVEKWKTEKISDFLYNIIRIYGWKSHSVDASVTIETMVRRYNKEYIEGGALNIAAFNSLMCLQYPLYDDVDLSYAFNWLQLLPLVDLFDALPKMVVYLITKDDVNEDESKKFISLFEKLNEKVNYKYLSKVLSALNGENYENEITNIDREISEYTAGRYSLILERVENNIDTIDNLMTKVNIIAKSYIYTSRKPKDLPILFSSIINNLISIYTLKESNQSISQLINLSIIYSNLEISDHILVSIMKSAPFFFDEKKKKTLIEKIKFLQTPLTPLACNLESPPSLYCDPSLKEIDIHRQRKYIIIDAISKGKRNTIDLINEYETNSPIRKDSIELRVEYYLKNSNVIELIEYSTNELILNPNSNICLPLEEIIYFINNEKIYSLDSIICAYYYNLYNSEDKSDVLNEFFEEYIISTGIERPSEFISEHLNDKEVIFLYNIAKIDVMDYLGCFEDDNDLKIERLKILNKLVMLEYLNQSDIDKECKYIVDSIFIDGQVARFNKAKVFVDTKIIYEKRKSEIEGLILKYHSTGNLEMLNENVKYIIEDMAVLKGDKNIIVGRIINILLLEFINNKEVGLDINLSTEIRHGFFNNLICSSPQSRHLITELDENGNYKANIYWKNYYEMINDRILNDVSDLLVKFSEDFNKLIDIAENWMKTSLNSDEDERVFFFEFSEDEFMDIKRMLNENENPDQIVIEIFNMFNEKLNFCLESMKVKLNVQFASQIDDLYSELISSISQAKRGTSMSDLLDEIQLSNTEVKEHIHTVCEWFALKKKNNLENIELEKLIHVSIKCFEQINNCKINVELEKFDDYYISGKHIYVLVLCIINFLNNSYKFSVDGLKVKINISGDSDEKYRILISNEMSIRAKDLLENGGFERICEKLINKNDGELLLNNGGSGLYKCLHALKSVSEKYNLMPSYQDDVFVVELTYGY